jgi:hypothetical protein
MTAWARLTWQAGDPAAFAVDLVARLGADLAGSAFDIVPWQAEMAGDVPQPGGRLVFEPALEALDTPAAAALPPEAGMELDLVGVGWATVELDRAETELAEWLVPREGDAPGDAGEDGVEPHLGARARCRRSDGLPGGTIVFLEPTTEGRLAASLVRDGEGPCALYLRSTGGVDVWVAGARRRGVTVSARGDGPFGPSVLVPGPGVAGPHVVVVG